MKNSNEFNQTLNQMVKEDSVDCEGLLLIPGFINAHTHIGDSIGKDVTLDRTVDEKIHPVFGIKIKNSKKHSSENLSNFMKIHVIL